MVAHMLHTQSGACLVSACVRLFVLRDQVTCSHCVYFFVVAFRIIWTVNTIFGGRR